MSMTSMNVSLREELKEFAEDQTKNGHSTPGEYVREMIRADQRRRAKDKLDAMLVEDLRSGESIPVDAKSWRELKQEAMTKLAAHKKTAKK